MTSSAGEGKGNGYHPVDPEIYDYLREYRASNTRDELISRATIVIWMYDHHPAVKSLSSKRLHRMITDALERSGVPRTMKTANPNPTYLWPVDVMPRAPENIRRVEV
jgi:hypothetical protein